MKFDIDTKAGIFRALASASLYDVGIQFGLEKHYKDPVAIRNRIYKIYREVSQDPGMYSVHPDTIELVVAAVSKRSIAVKKPDVPTMAETQHSLKEADIKTLTVSSRDRAGRLIGQKLEYIENHPNALRNESLVTLGKIFGILFDKAQIIQGQATEHVAVMSTIDSNMSPEDALATVLKFREVVQTEKYG